MKKLRKYFYYAIAIFIITIGALIYWKYCFTYSEGYRAGLLQKFSKKGNMFKTYEGELILSSVESNRNVALASEKFLFTVPDEEVAHKLEQMEGQMISVHYEEKNGVLFWRGDTKYLVDSARVMSE